MLCRILKQDQSPVVYFFLPDDWFQKKQKRSGVQLWSFIRRIIPYKNAKTSWQIKNHGDWKKVRSTTIRNNVSLKSLEEILVVQSLQRFGHLLWMLNPENEIAYGMRRRWGCPGRKGFVAKIGEREDCLCRTKFIESVVYRWNIYTAKFSKWGANEVSTT